MPIGAHPLQLALVAAFAVTLSIRGTNRRDVGRRAAHLSFIGGAAWMIFSEDRWFPPGASIFALATWAVSGWICGLLMHAVVVQLTRLVPGVVTSHRAERQ
jgi:hypothetical protein